MGTLVGDVWCAEFGLCGGKRGRVGAGEGELEGGEGLAEGGANETKEFDVMDGALGETSETCKCETFVIGSVNGVELEGPEGALRVSNKELGLLAHVHVVGVEEGGQHLDPLESLFELGKGRDVDARGQEEAVGGDGDELATEVDGVADTGRDRELLEVEGREERDGFFSDQRVHRPQRRQD